MGGKNVVSILRVIDTNLSKFLPLLQALLTYFLTKVLVTNYSKISSFTPNFLSSLGL